MTISNRIKCAVTIDANGRILVGVPITGFRALAGISAGAMVDGTHPFTLENSAGDVWESGYVHVSGGAIVPNGVVERTVVDSSSAGAAVFTSASGGLTLTQRVMAEDVGSGAGLPTNKAFPGNFAVGGANITGSPAVGAVAIGPNATCEGDYATTVGSGAWSNASGVAVGQSAGSGANGVAIGSAANVSNTGGGVAIGLAAASTATAGVAIGNASSASVGGVAVGWEAITAAPFGVAIGKGASAAYQGMTAIGGSEGIPSKRSFPMTVLVEAGGGTVPLTDISASAVNLGAWTNGSSWWDGPLQIKGVARLTHPSFGSDVTYTKMIEYSYLLWQNKTAQTMTVIGTPTFTTLYTGSNAPSSTLAVHATAGVLTVSAPSSGFTRVFTLLEISSMAHYF